MQIVIVFSPPHHLVALRIGIANANRDLLEAIKNIEFGQAQPRNGVNLNGRFQRNRIEPTTSTRTPSRGAELVTTLSKPPTDIVKKLCWERARTDASRVRLSNAQHVVQIKWTKARTRRRPTRGGV